MAIQKKHGKGRLDKWYKLAKEKGYRARAAFKLIQLNKKYGFLENSKVLLDLCAAPGSWCQVAAEVMPVNSLIVGVDLAPIKPIPKVITFQSDITTDKCRATIRQHFKTWKADTVLHDGAPNVGTSWNQDSFNQAELVLQSMKLATEFLVEGGTFVTKVFRSKDYNPLLWVFQQLFTKVEATKPPSSRNVSAEIFVVCKGYKAPKHIDPRFLDPRAVFAELKDGAPNNEAKVYNPQQKKRKRDGYEEGDYTQFKEVPASEFIQTTDPLQILGNTNKLSLRQPPNGDVALAVLEKHPLTTEEIRTCCDDLKVLGRKDFKLLLKWRLKMREVFGLATKKTEEQPVPEEEVAEVESMDEELQIQEELQSLKDKENAKKKRERRKENEKKQKEIVRMQLNMTAPMDIGMEQDSLTGTADSMFNLKTVDKGNVGNKLAKGRMIIPRETEQQQKDSGLGSSGETDDESDEEADKLERQLDGMYEQYQERKAEADAKYRAKKAREEHNDEFEGFSAEEDAASGDELEMEEGSSDESDGDEAAGNNKPLVTDLQGTAAEKGALSRRAQNFFSQDMFKDIDGLVDESEDDAKKTAEKTGDEDVDDAEIDAMIEKAKFNSAKQPRDEVAKKKAKQQKKPSAKDLDGFDESSEDEENKNPNAIQTVKRGDPSAPDNWDDDDKRKADGTLDIDIITAEAMTLAHQLATGQKTSHDVVDDGFNRHSFRDRDGLPEWFLDDEGQHDKPHKPITKAAASAIQEKMRAYNARPIKKVREAKARKKFKTAQRLEKLKKKSDLLVNDEGLTEKEKAETISKMMKKANQVKRRPKPTVVVAKGLNRGVKGRPKGVKGRYTILDPRMKKEMRAQKRAGSKKKR